VAARPTRKLDGKCTKCFIPSGTVPTDGQLLRLTRWEGGDPKTLLEQATREFEPIFQKGLKM
jgi:hypothetical protein